MMPFRLQQSLVRAIWPLACLVVAGPNLYMLSVGGPTPESLYSMDGRIAAHIAAQFTSAPSALSAGSDRIALTSTLLFWARMASTLLFVTLAVLQGSTWASRGALRRPAMFALQMLLSLTNDAGLAYIFAAQIGSLVHWRAVLAWLGATLLASSALKLVLVALPLTANDKGFTFAAVIVATEAMMQCMIAAMVHIGLRERRGRIALTAANAELVATQALLGEAVRASERLRIARDLHDMTGHHLTALKLHLDLATRQAGPHAPASLATASELASTLLAEVRLLVSAERGDRHIDLSGALTTLCAGVPIPRIALRIEPQLAIDSATVAHTVFCAVQEAISNAMRHAQASHMTIVVRRCEHGDVVIDIEDNGCGSKGAEGNGLRGMRERLAQVGGKLVAANGSHGGFTLALRLPANGMAA
jgi:two-component system sensor histidine kinase DesK